MKIAPRVPVYALIAGVICLIASLIWSDLIFPRYGWDGQVGPLLSLEVRAFAAIVAVPSWINDLMGLPQSSYGCAAEVSWCHELYIPPPAVAAVEFMRVGYPFWFATTTIIGETIVILLRRSSRNRSITF